MVAHLDGQVRRLFEADIGRVGDHQVEAAEPQGRRQVGRHQSHPIVDAVPAGVGSRHRQGGREQVGGDQPGGRQLARESHRQAAGAGAQVEDPRPRRQGELEGQLDEMLRLRPRDEHPPVDREEAAVELALAEDVGDRLAAQTTLEQRLEALDGRRLQHVLGMGQHVRLVATQDPGHEQLGLAPGGPERGRRQPPAGVGQQPAGCRGRGHAPAQPAAAARIRSASKWAASGSMSGSSSPSRIAGNWCTVSPTRWSVTLFCGKL